MGLPDEIQFEPDHTAFPLWAKDDRGVFALNLERSSSVRSALSDDLWAALRSWAEQWGSAENDEDGAARLALSDEASALVERLRDELGSRVTVSSWFEAR